MPRILAIDYGTKKSGIAETDDLKMIASPLETVATSGLLDYLKTYINKYEVDTIVVGDPRRWDNSETHATHPANEFCKKLAKHFPNIQIEREDESFTSKMAMQSLIMGGAKKKTRRDKTMLDKVSAAIILQSYLQRISP